MCRAREFEQLHRFRSFFRLNHHLPCRDELTLETITRMGAGVGSFVVLPSLCIFWRTGFTWLTALSSLKSQPGSTCERVMQVAMFLLLVAFCLGRLMLSPSGDVHVFVRPSVVPPGNLISGQLWQFWVTFLFRKNHFFYFYFCLLPSACWLYSQLWVKQGTT